MIYISRHLNVSCVCGYKICTNLSDNGKLANSYSTKMTCLGAVQVRTNRFTMAPRLPKSKYIRFICVMQLAKSYLVRMIWGLEEASALSLYVDRWASFLVIDVQLNHNCFCSMQYIRVSVN